MTFRYITAYSSEEDTQVVHSFSLFLLLTRLPLRPSPLPPLPPPFPDLHSLPPPPPSFFHFSSSSSPPLFFLYSLPPSSAYLIDSLLPFPTSSPLISSLPIDPLLRCPSPTASPARCEEHCSEKHLNRCQGRRSLDGRYSMTTALRSFHNRTCNQ